MKDTSEIKALFELLDDPDQNIYEAVSQKIIHYGKEIIPNLETYWEQNLNNVLHERIENLIHQVNLNDCLNLFNKWNQTPSNNLLEGALIFAQYKYPNYDKLHCKEIFKKIIQNCWLELNQYLTPLEKITIINSIFYNFEKMKHFELTEDVPAHFYINEVLETKKGNNFTLGILYQALCYDLDIPMFAIQLPRQHLLAYIENYDEYLAKDKQINPSILFFMDPSDGTYFSQNDVDTYLKKYDFKKNENTFKPMSHQQIIFNTIQALSGVYASLKMDKEMNDLNLFLTLSEQNSLDS